MNQNHKQGDVLILQMMPPQKGKMPISRTKEGLICLMNRNKKGFYPVGSTWTCEVDEVREKSLIVTPIEQEISAEENALEVERKIKSSFAKDKTKKERVKKEYQYKRNGE